MANQTIAIARTVADLRRIVAGWRKDAERVALVPTMGALHAGHIALVEKARTLAKRSVASIFVNPAQFAPHEDFGRYPRTFDADCEKLTAAGCDLVWAPDVQAMYPEGFATRIVPAGAAEGLETDFRPHFFGGVATVCCKLFTQVQPDFAVFGQKDYQQLQVVTQMVRDLDLPLEVVGLPTIRESDGLAMSSRNAYLDAAQRKSAASMYAAISEVARAVAGGGDIVAATTKARQHMLFEGFEKVDYVEVRDAVTLKPVATGSKAGMRVLAAAWLGKTRLIDNVAVV